ncbi:hypothetical protein E2C01_047938 [Portunus trituberculatus]|uniref:Uncharacterized protein n=1 Tax=Portunus trituberculatus TaxID=210409 RepID=A0A5B7G8T9_PORTR|nr:hypothetical protein [Portunus trituberculatus]
MAHPQVKKILVCGFEYHEALRFPSRVNLRSSCMGTSRLALRFDDGLCAGHFEGFFEIHEDRGSLSPFYGLEHVRYTVCRPFVIGVGIDVGV